MSMQAASTTTTDVLSQGSRCPQSTWLHRYILAGVLKQLDTHIEIDHYLTHVQVDINAKMRAILVDWLVEVHLKFKVTVST